MESRFGVCVVLSIILIVLPGAWAGNEPKVDPQTGLIRILFIGDSLMEAGHITPFLYQDPIMALTRVPIYINNDLDERLLRLYFPRHQRQIYEGQDVIILASKSIEMTTSKSRNRLSDQLVFPFSHSKRRVRIRSDVPGMIVVGMGQENVGDRHI